MMTQAEILAADFARDVDGNAQALRVTPAAIIADMIDAEEQDAKAAEADLRKQYALGRALLKTHNIWYSERTRGFLSDPPVPGAAALQCGWVAQEPAYRWAWLEPKADRLLTVRDVAAKLRVTEPTVREWIARGELPALELGGRTGYRITETDLEAFMQSRKKYLDRHQLPEKESAELNWGLNGNHHGAFATLPEDIKYLGDGEWNLPDGATAQPLGGEDWIITMADGTEYRCWTED